MNRDYDMYKSRSCEDILRTMLDFHNIPICYEDGKYRPPKELIEDLKLIYDPPIKLTRIQPQLELLCDKQECFDELDSFLGTFKIVQGVMDYR